MDGAILFHTMLNSALLLTLLFGSYLVYKQIPKSRVKSVFLSMLIFWSILLFVGFYDQLTRLDVSNGESSPLNFNAILTGVISQLYMLYLYYSLLFSAKTTRRIVAWHFAIMLVLFGVMWVVDLNVDASSFDTYDSIESAYSHIFTPLMSLKLLVVIVQLLFSAAVIFVSHRLVPIYQRYVEQNESNTACNMLWIKEVSSLLSVLTFFYAGGVLFYTFANVIAYDVVAICAFFRLINIFLQHNILDNFDDMYATLGIKWSWSKMWYVDEVKPIEKPFENQIFDSIIEWINTQRPYVNSQFSFKDVVDQFPDFNYNEFDAMLRNRTGFSFQTYIRECRVNHAVEIISEESELIRVKEIAFRVGFDNNSAFSRAFKAVKGVSVTEWKEANDHKQ